MELYELLEKKDDIEADIKYYKKEKERLEIKTGLKSTNLDSLRVQGGHNTRDQALIELSQASLDLDEAIKKLDNIISLTNTKYNNFIKHNDFDKQIYTEKKLYRWSNNKISIRHNGISKSSIYRIVDEIEGLGKNGKL